LPRSVPSASEAQATFAATLFDEWIRAGLRDVVISPGSRSTPLVLAAVGRRELNLHVRLDERSAGFFAIGRALATKTPVAVVVTSGTAAAELHACVAEADLAGVPLLVVTADRPPELHGVGAPQTIEQGHLYGAMVRRFEDPGVANDDASPTWRPLASRLWRSAHGEVAQAGPVHLNAAFIEPLIGIASELPEGRADNAPWDETVFPIEERTQIETEGLSVLCVVGAGVSPRVVEECQARKWVVLGDATAQGTLAYYDTLLRSREFVARTRPDVVIRLGGLPASKVLGEQLRAWNVRTIGFDGAGLVADPDRLVSETYPGLPGGTSVANAEYVATWSRASEVVDAWLLTLDAQENSLNEPLVARAVVAASTASGASLVAGSSMPVRDVEWWTPPRRVASFSNRGVNGIDGVVSTVLGVAAGSRSIGLVGDLTMLHDVSGLVDGLGAAGGTCVLVVTDNRGGGIFSFLAQAKALTSDRFELLFGTPRPHNLEIVATAFGHAAATVNSLDELRVAIDKGLSSDGLSVIVANVPARDENVRLHQSWNETVVQLLASDYA
jgi:2-succinyl-5-enolpyruvyl-6-hydroxy-3-cyclohexene-1-carboxylate synthase